MCLHIIQEELMERQLKIWQPCKSLILYDKTLTQADNALKNKFFFYKKQNH